MPQERRLGSPGRSIPAPSSHAGCAILQCSRLRDCAWPPTPSHAASGTLFPVRSRLTVWQAQPLGHVRPEGQSVGPKLFCLLLPRAPLAALGRSHGAERLGFKGEIPSVVCLPMGPMATFSLLPFALVGLQPSLEGPHPDISLPGCQDPPPWLGASFGVAMNKLKRGQRRACVG